MAKRNSGWVAAAFVRAALIIAGVGALPACALEEEEPTGGATNFVCSSDQECRDRNGPAWQCVDGQCVDPEAACGSEGSSTGDGCNCDCGLVDLDCAVDECLPSEVPRDDLWVTNGDVLAFAQGDGVLYLGGSFTYVGPVTGSFVALDASTGALDTSLPRVNGTVQVAEPDGSGGWYIGGSFTHVGGVPRSNLAHLDGDGRLDLAFAPEPIAFAPEPTVFALVLSGDTLYAGGDFTSISGQLRNHIAALDAATGAATDWNPDADGQVRALAVSGSTVYVGGGFSNIGGRARHTIAAVDADTGAATGWDPGWDPGPGSACCAPVSAIAVSGTTVYVAGEFERIGGQMRTSLAALDASTGAATDWNPAPGDWTPENGVRALAVSGTTVYVGGEFSQIGGQMRTNLAGLDAATGAATDWNPDFDGIVSTLAVSGTTVYAGGGQALAGLGRLAAFDALTGAATEWAADAGGEVLSLSVSGSSLYVGGSFTTVGGERRKGIVALDASTGAATDWDPSSDNADFATVTSLAVSGGTVYVGGQFERMGGQGRNNIAALDASTGAATEWDPSADGRVYALVVSGGTVYAGGNFTNIGGAARNHIAALDASTGAATAWDPNAGRFVVSLLASGSTIFAGGLFRGIGGEPGRFGIAALDVTTGAATSWNPTAQLEEVDDYGGPERNAFLASGSTVYVTGSTIQPSGEGSAEGVHWGIAALDVTTGAARDWRADASSAVKALAVRGSTIFVGPFWSIGEQTSNGIAALDARTGEVTLWNPSATYVSNADVFVLAVSQGTLYAAGDFVGVSDRVDRHFVSFGP